MKCKNCEYELTEEVTVCPKCGGAVELEETTEVSDETVIEDEVKERKARKKKVKLKKYMNASSLGVIISIIIIVLGIATMCGMFTFNFSVPNAMRAGNTVESKYYSYGGDAYTGIQHAAAEASVNAAMAAENIVITNQLIKIGLVSMYTMQEVISKTVGLLIIAIGVLGLCYFSLQKKRSVTAD